MAQNKSRPFDCDVVNEVVRIRLTTRRVGGFSGEDRPFMQCDQLECQYVDENKPPCPLNLKMFPDEIDEQGEWTRRRGESEIE